MKTEQKMNLGQKIRYLEKTIEEAKQIIRDAHKKGLLLDLRIKDYPIIQKYLSEVVRPRRTSPVPEPTLEKRLHQHLVQLPPDDWSRECQLHAGRIRDYDPNRKLWLVYTSNYLYTYNNYKDIYRNRQWLCGKDDGGYFRHQIPCTIDNIDDALKWVTPAVVKKAIAGGKQVLRQGEVWFVETTRRCDNTDAIPQHHHWNPLTRDCTHDEHSLLHVPFNFRAYINKSMGVID